MPTLDPSCAAREGMLFRRMSEVTQLLEAVKVGRPGADEQLWRAVYDELRRMAGALVKHEAREITLSGTVLVHEAWLNLGGGGTAQTWEGRCHFFSAAAEAMRRILVDHARARLRQKRGGGEVPLELGDAEEVPSSEHEKLLLVHEVLDELAQVDLQKADIVKLRFFVGYTHEEIAALLGVSDKTVRRQWSVAKVWLFQALKSRSDAPKGVPEKPDRFWSD